jgi:hypothetical protein
LDKNIKNKNNDYKYYVSAFTGRTYSVPSKNNVISKRSDLNRYKNISKKKN